VGQGRVVVLGAAARVFRKGQEPVDLAPEADLGGLLGVA
jgi:hypothetical protein